MAVDRETVLQYEGEYESIMNERGRSGEADQRGEQELRVWFERHRYVDREHLLQLGEWKAPHRIRQYLVLNSDGQIETTTAEAIESRDERFKFFRLQDLKGVGPAVASVILHFAHPEQYMIYDARALQSLGWPIKSNPSFRDWERYTDLARKLSDDLGLPIRTIDKALWAHSERQGAALRP
jgi:hypothetical protein